MDNARVGNRYIADEEPWKVIKTDETRVKTILYVSLQITASLAILFEPFLPFSSARLRRLLTLENEIWDSVGNEVLLPEGSQLQRPELLFRKVEDEEIRFQTDKLATTIASNTQKGIGQYCITLALHRLGKSESFFHKMIDFISRLALYYCKCIKKKRQLTKNQINFCNFALDFEKCKYMVNNSINKLPGATTKAEQ